MVRLETSIPGLGLDRLGGYGPRPALESRSAAHPGQRGHHRRRRRDVSPRGCASLARGAVPAEPSGADRARTSRRLRLRPAAGFDLEGLERLRPTSTGSLICSWPRGARRMTRNTTGELTCRCCHEPFEPAQGRRGCVADVIGGGRRPSFGDGPRRRALTRGRRRSLKLTPAGVPDQVLAAMTFVFFRAGHSR